MADYSGMTPARAAFQASYDAQQAAAATPAPVAPTATPQAGFYDVHQQSQISGTPTTEYNKAVANLGIDTTNTFSGVNAINQLGDAGYYTGKPTSGAVLNYGADVVEGGNALYQVGGDMYNQALAGSYVQNPLDPTNTTGYTGTQTNATIPYTNPLNAQPQQNALYQAPATGPATAEQIAQSFQDILGREAPQSYIDSVLSSGQSIENIATAMSQSPEALNNAQTGSYTPPQGSIPSSTPVSDTPLNAPLSQPMAQGAGQYTDESVKDLVDYHFNNELGRSPNPEGAKWWADQLQSGAVTEQQMKQSILDIAREAGESPQQDKTAIRGIFETGFGEDISQQEMDFWSKELASGNITMAELPQAIAASGEDFDMMAVEDDYFNIIKGTQAEDPFSYDETDPLASLGYDPEEEFKFDEEDPSFQFRKSEAMKAIERGAAARGGALSGRALKEAERYASELASQEYGAEYARWNADRLDRFNLSQAQQQNAYNQQLTDYNTRQNLLLNLANMGMGAMGQTQAAGGAYGGQVGSNLSSMGNAQAAGYLGAGQAQAQGLGNVAGAIQGGVSNMMMYDKLRK